MTDYPRSAYTNIYGSVDPNAIPDGWGPWQYPGGVPNELLDTLNFTLRDDSGNAITSGNMVMRKELTTLVGLCISIAHDLHDYIIWGYPNPGGEPTWGPWSYENRTISGSSTPSNHSKGRAWDINAPNNSYTDWSTCEIPPALVADFQSVGWYWGGFYGDRMHFEYCQPLSSVPALEQRARDLLAGSGGGSAGPIPIPETPEPSEEDDDMPLSDDDVKRVADAVWAKQFADPDFLHGSRQSMAQWVAGTRQFADELPDRFALIVGESIGAKLDTVRQWTLQAANKVLGFKPGK